MSTVEPRQPEWLMGLETAPLIRTRPIKHLLEITVFLTSVLAQADIGIADRHLRAILDHDGTLIEEQGDWLLGIDVEQHLAHTTLTLVTKPVVFTSAPQCVMNGSRPESLIVDYFLGSTAAVNGSGAPGKIVLRLSRQNSRARGPFIVTCY